MMIDNPALRCERPATREHRKNVPASVGLSNVKVACNHPEAREPGKKKSLKKLPTLEATENLVQNMKCRQKR
jgi:hypothetical protein